MTLPFEFIDQSLILTIGASLPETSSSSSSPPPSITTDCGNGIENEHENEASFSVLSPVRSLSPSLDWFRHNNR